MWKSPIEIAEEITKQIDMDFENGIIKAVQKVGIDVNKEEPLISLGFERLEDIICSQPIVEAKEVVHGEWIVGSKPRCSVCGKSALREYDCESWLSYVPSDFCPHCGADMRTSAE